METTAEPKAPRTPRPRRVVTDPPVDRARLSVTDPPEADLLDDEPEAPPRARALRTEAPIEIDGEPLAMVSPEDEVDDEDLAPGLPLIKGAKVIYIGAKRNMSVALVGSILTEPIYSDEEAELSPAGEPLLDEHGMPRPKRIGEHKTCIGEGVQGYDFATHDNRGRPIRQHRMPDDPRLDSEVRNRRYVIVEHPAHLLHFQRSRDAAGTREFRVFVPEKYRPAYKNFVAEQDLRSGNQRRLQRRTIEDIE